MVVIRRNGGAADRNGGPELRGGTVPLERPRPIAGACAARVRRRTGDLPACGALDDSHQAPGGGIRRIGPPSRWRVGQATTVPPARHSTRVGSGWVQAVKLCPVGSARRVVALGCGTPSPPGPLPRVGARGVQHRPGGDGDVAGDPSTSRSGARTFAGSPATWRLLSSRGWGEAHDIRRPPALWN